MTDPNINPGDSPKFTPLTEEEALAAAREMYEHTRNVTKAARENVQTILTQSREAEHAAQQQEANELMEEAGRLEQELEQMGDPQTVLESNAAFAKQPKEQRDLKAREAQIAAYVEQAKRQRRLQNRMLQIKERLAVLQRQGIDVNQSLTQKTPQEIQREEVDRLELELRQIIGRVGVFNRKTVDAENVDPETELDYRRAVNIKKRLRQLREEGAVISADILASIDAKDEDTGITVISPEPDVDEKIVNERREIEEKRVALWLAMQPVATDTVEVPAGAVQSWNQ